MRRGNSNASAVGNPASVSSPRASRQAPHNPTHTTQREESHIPQQALRYNSSQQSSDNNSTTPLLSQQPLVPSTSQSLQQKIYPQQFQPPVSSESQHYYTDSMNRSHSTVEPTASQLMRTQVSAQQRPATSPQHFPKPVQPVPPPNLSQSQPASSTRRRLPQLPPDGSVSPYPPSDGRSQAGVSASMSGRNLPQVPSVHQNPQVQVISATPSRRSTAQNTTPQYRQRILEDDVGGGSRQHQYPTVLRQSEQAQPPYSRQQHQQIQGPAGAQSHSHTSRNINNNNNQARAFINTMSENMASTRQTPARKQQLVMYDMVSSIDQSGAQSVDSVHSIKAGILKTTTPQ